MPCSIMLITQFFLGTKTLHELGFLNFNDSLEVLGILVTFDPFISFGVLR